MDFFTCHLEFTTVGLVSTGDHLNESGFPRSVFSEKCVDFAGQQLERDALQCTDRAEGFADVRELEEGFQSVSGWVTGGF